jgi:hypothetical protein
VPRRSRLRPEKGIARPGSLDRSSSPRGRSRHGVRRRRRCSGRVCLRMRTLSSGYRNGAPAGRCGSVEPPRRAAPLPPANAPGDCGSTGHVPAALRRRRRRDLSRVRIALCQCVERSVHEINAPSSLRPPPKRAGGATCEAAGRPSPEPIQTATPPPTALRLARIRGNVPHSLVLLLCASF